MKTRQRVIAFLSAVILGLGGAVALEAPASAYSYGPFRIIHASGLCLEVPNYSYTAGEQLKLNYCGDDSVYNQFFHLDDSPYFNYTYFIRPPFNWFALMPGDARLANSTVLQWYYNVNQTREIWTLNFPNGIYDDERQFINAFQGWCLTVDSAYVGAYVRNNACTTGNPPVVVANTIWYLDEVY